MNLILYLPEAWVAEKLEDGLVAVTGPDVSTVDTFDIIAGVQMKKHAARTAIS